MVNEAYKILGDPSTRAEYDRDLKKFNLKDGQGLNTAKDYKRQSSMNKDKKETEKNAPPAEKEKPREPAHKPVEIPENIEGLTVK
jgi:curved DNA-binding protein CbpA